MCVGLDNQCTFPCCVKCQCSQLYLPFAVLPLFGIAQNRIQNRKTLVGMSVQIKYRVCVYVCSEVLNGTKCQGHRQGQAISTCPTYPVAMATLARYTEAPRALNKLIGQRFYRRLYFILRMNNNEWTSVIDEWKFNLCHAPINLNSFVQLRHWWATGASFSF